jgi:hypothetical protein
MVPAVFACSRIVTKPVTIQRRETNTWTALFDEQVRAKQGLNVDR